MNKCYLMGKIIEKSEYKFFYNSKKHNAEILIEILTIDSNIRKGTKVEIVMYDGIADYAYRKCNIGEEVFIEGKIVKEMKIEGEKIEKIRK